MRKSPNDRTKAVDSCECAGMTLNDGGLTIKMYDKHNENMYQQHIIKSPPG